MPDTHPDLCLIESLLRGDVPDVRQRQLEEHFTACASCRQKLEQIAAGDIQLPEASSLSPIPSTGEHLGEVIAQLQDGATNRPSQAKPLTKLSFLDPSNDASCLGRLGPFRVLGEVGRGNMGIVLRARDDSLNRTVALKVLDPQRSFSAQDRERFLREARSAAAVGDERIITVHAVDIHERCPYLVMEYIAGQSLEELMDAGPLPFEELCRIAAEVAGGLAAAHARGLVHRDIKPSNILLEEQTGRVKITDFGLAKAVDDARLTAPGVIAGTPEFMSPEQASGEPIESNSDMFSLGIVLYAGRAGRTPFAADTIYETLQHICREAHTPLREIDSKTPPWFCDLVDGLLQKEPRRRKPSAAEVETLLKEKSQSGRARRDRSRWVATLLTASAALLTVATIVWFSWHANDLPQEPAAPSERRPTSGFHLAGSERNFSDLAQAIAAAESGNVIEVYGDGPFLTPPIRIEGKSLTIRAAGDSRPVILSAAPSQRSDAPFVTTDAELHLQGLELHWALAGAGPGRPSDTQLSQCAIVSKGGPLEVRNCRVVVARMNGCVGTTGGETVIRDSFLISSLGPCMLWSFSPNERMEIDNSVLEGNAVLILDGKTAGAEQGAATLQVTHSTLSARRALQYSVAAEHRCVVSVVAEGNLLDVSQVCNLIAAGELAGIELFALDLASLLQWQEEGNVYRRNRAFVTYSMARRRAWSMSSGPSTLPAWLALWELPSDASIEGDLRFHPRDEGVNRPPPVLAAIESPSGKLPGRVGAEVEEIR